MPLSEEQQKSLNTLTHLASRFASDAAYIRQAEVLKLFDTGGRKTDLSKQSDQQLKAMFEVGWNTITVNEMPPEEKLNAFCLVEHTTTSQFQPPARPA